jgi:hypothetical protein
MEKNSSDTNKTKILSQTERRVCIVLSAIFLLLMMSVQKPWEHKYTWFFGARLGIYGWDDFILWTIIPLVIFWGILWVRKWKKFW